jgi:predicted nucleotidyltransferase
MLSSQTRAQTANMGAYRQLWYNALSNEDDMTVVSASDPVLSRFRSALDEMYGERIERVILFGSRARGDALESSDYDVAVFLKNLRDRWLERQRLADLRVKLIDDTGAFFDFLPFPAEAYAERSPLMREIRLEGLDI